MLWYCRFTWYPGTTADQVRQRVLQQHAAGTNHPEKIRGWYNLAGGGAGFMLIDAEGPRDLNIIIEPYMDLVSWDVHAVYELPYSAVTERFRQMVEAAGGPPSAERNKATIRRFIEEVWNKGDLAVVDELVPASGVAHIAGTPDLVGPEATKQYVAMYRNAFPDTRLVLDELIAEGDRVVCRWTGSGTHQGEFQGTAATGKRVSIGGMLICRVADDKLIETWGEFDALGMMQQLGAVPAAAPAAR